MMKMTETVKQLVIINVIFFFGSQWLGPIAYEYLSLYYIEHPNFRFWQPLTHMFMHAPLPSLSHILFNMFGLVMFGAALEHFWGGKKFLFFYISCGFGAAFIHTGVNYYHVQKGIQILLENGYEYQTIIELIGQRKYNPQWQQLMDTNVFNDFMGSFITPAVGASGALYGILVAFAFMFPNVELMLLFVPIPIKAKYFVSGLVVLDLYLGISGTSLFGGGGIAHFAHVGGALTGLLMMYYWKKTQFNSNRWDL